MSSLQTQGNASGLPFDDIRDLLKLLPDVDAEAAAAAGEREVTLVKPSGALGRLESLAAWAAGWQGQATPTCRRPVVAIFAGDHGVTAQGVSPYPSSVTRQMLETFSAGGAAINQICASYDLGLKVFDLAIGMPTGDISIDAAMDEKGTAATIAFGMEAIAGGTDLLALGEMGIGNTTVAAAIYLALFGGKASDWTGRGTGLDDAGLQRKTSVVERAVALHRSHLDDPLEVLRRLGGREIAALCGAILAARLQRIPVILDGYVVCAAAAILHAMDRTALDHCIAAHVSAEGAHRAVLQRLGLDPLLDLGLRLGEGSGAALAAGIVKAAIACHTGMATFASASVTGRTVQSPS